MSKIEKIDKNSIKTTEDFLYDENGNLLKDASHEYIYDKKARLVGVDNNISYAYNHENTRVSKTVNAKTTHFIYDGAKLIGEYHSDGSVKNEYLYLDNIPVGVIPRGYPQDGVKYIHTDHLGTPRRLADENGAIVWSWESEPFGESKAVGSVEFNLRFAGQYYDNETSTHYNINRDYDPKTGRYIESDPIGFDGGINSYGYVGGNPLVRIDPCGKFVILLPELIDLGYMTLSFTVRQIVGASLKKGVGAAVGLATSGSTLKVAPCYLYKLKGCKTGYISYGNDKILNDPLYYGISKNPLNRYTQHIYNGAIAKHGCQNKCVSTMEIIYAFDDRQGCKDKEAIDIKRQQPIWNEQLNYDLLRFNKRQKWRDINCK